MKLSRTNYAVQVLDQAGNAQIVQVIKDKNKDPEPAIYGLRQTAVQTMQSVKKRNPDKKFRIVTTTITQIQSDWK